MNFILQGCQEQLIYDHYVLEDSLNWVVDSMNSCSNLIRKPVEIMIRHENITILKDSLYLDLEDTVVAVVLNKREFFSVPICLDHGRRTAAIRIGYNDRLNRRIYIWQNEAAYDLSRIKKIEIVLKSKQKIEVDDGAFRIVY